MSDWIQIDPRYEIKVTRSYSFEIMRDGRVFENDEEVKGWRAIDIRRGFRAAMGESIADMAGIEPE